MFDKIKEMVGKRKKEDRAPTTRTEMGKGKLFKKGGSIDGCEQRGKTKGRMI